MNIWSGIFALSGVALGWLGSLFNERTRWKRVEETRWHDERRKAYARFLQAADALTNSLVRIVTTYQSKDARLDVMERVVRDSQDLLTIKAEIDIIGGEAVREASRRVAMNFFQREDLQRAILFDDALDKRAVELLQDALSEHHTLVDAFNAAARKDLGLPAGARSVKAQS